VLPSDGTDTHGGVRPRKARHGPTSALALTKEHAAAPRGLQPICCAPERQIGAIQFQEVEGVEEHGVVVARSALLAVDRNVFTPNSV